MSQVRLSQAVPVKKRASSRTSEPLLGPRPAPPWLPVVPSPVCPPARPPLLVSRRPRLLALRRASGCSRCPAPSPCFLPQSPLSRFRPFPGPSARPLTLHSRPWPSGASPALSPPAQAPGNHRPPPQVLPRPVSAPPSFTQHLRPLTCVLTAYPGSTLEPGRAPGGSGFLPGAPGLPLAPFASPTPLWNPWAAPLYLPKTLPGPPGPSLLSLEPWSSCWLFLESSLGPQASPPPSPAGSPGLLPALAPSLLCLHFAFTPLPLCSFSSVPAPSCRAPSLFFLSLWVSSAPFPSRCSSWPLSSSPSSQSLVDSPKHPGVGARQASAVGVRRLVLFSFC